MAAVMAGMTPKMVKVVVVAEAVVTRALRAWQTREMGPEAATNRGAIGPIEGIGGIGGIGGIAETGEIAATGGGEIGSIAMAGVIGGTGDADVAAGVPRGGGAAAISRRCPTRPLS